MILQMLEEYCYQHSKYCYLLCFNTALHKTGREPK